MTKKRLVFVTFSLALMASLIGGAVFGQATQQKDRGSSIYRYLSIFSEVFDLVRSNYVEQVAPDQLMDGAFAGVTDAVDEFSYYVPPAQMAAYKNFVDVEDNGVGLVVTKRFGYALVVSAVPESPADKAGIERGDFIETINGQPTEKLAIWQVRSALASKRPIRLHVIHGGQTKRQELTITPATFHPLAIQSEQHDGVAVLRIPYFEKGSAAQFMAQLEEVRKRGSRKLIVDVRGNAAGDVEEAIRAADALLAGGTITSLQGRKVDAKRWDADKATSFDGDVLVLTDSSTAAAGEVFAGAIHGNSRGKTVGVTTFGKSIYQRFITLPSGGGVQMTIGHYTTPDLKPISESGLRPDVIVDLTEEAIDGESPTSVKSKEDVIMKKALSIFGEQRESVKKAA
jgi:carboxyl-terminal processing protease